MGNCSRDPMTCPKCGKRFTGHPAISRVDNRTEICSECGAREALEAFVSYMKTEAAPDDTKKSAKGE